MITSSTGMWEGDMLDCFDDRCLFLQSSLNIKESGTWELKSLKVDFVIFVWMFVFLRCPWYRFGENMRLAGFGSCFLQGFFYIILATIALCNFVAFVVTKKHCFLFLGAAFVISLGTYLGFHRIKMRNKFNI